jgi:hypothetical protein
MRGHGPLAQLIARRFEVACAKYGYARRGGVRPDTSQFAPPRATSPQAELF